MSLFFNSKRIEVYQKKIKMGDYFVCIAQNRKEKGFEHILNILSFLKSNVKIKILFARKKIQKIF